jgi:hypothetical protein
MANRSFLSVWLKEMPEEQIADRLTAFLSTVPVSATKPGFARFAIRAVDGSEAPVVEDDLRASPLDAPGIVELASEHLHGDSSYEVSCWWDLAVFDAASGRSTVGPQPVEIICHGEDYDGGFWRDAGHFHVDLGLEHLYTGHAGLLGLRTSPRPAPQSVEESRFFEVMAWPENLEKYQRQTRDNIRKLQNWVRQIEASLPVDRMMLWSEGEENFEARLNEITAAR